jgi:WhiB family redox-sensing transcriptional regulator
MREPRQYEAPLCAQTGSGDSWFPEPGQGLFFDTTYARSICGRCIHQTECAEWGIRYEKFGIWGGLTERDRKVIRRKQNIILREENSA